MIKALISDLDGTLVRHKPEYIKSTVENTLSELGLPYDKKFLEYFAPKFWYGSDRNKIIEEELRTERMKFWNVFWKHDNAKERAKHTEVYDDVSALIDLRRKGFKLGIVTGALTEVANAEISKIKLKFNDFGFDSIVSNNPHDEAVYVGDLPEDVDAAIRAQVKPVVILREPIRSVNYDSSVKVISSLYEIESVI
jgi:phosphoglycolate phosphatase-like HAD superfamily hydrolase